MGFGVAAIGQLSSFDHAGMQPSERPLQFETAGRAIHIDGRPRFAKLSIDDVKKVEIAAIDPDFGRGYSPLVPDGIC